MRVGIATRDWSPTVNPDGTHSLGGSGHYRCGLVAKALTTLGHDVVLGTLTSRRRELGVMTWDGVNHGEFDVMLLQRWMFVDLPPVIEAARARGQVVLNDVDDWWEGLDTGNAAWASSHARSSPIENRDHYRRVLGASSAIVCSTPFLASWYSRLAPTITVPNCLDLDRWVPEGRSTTEPPVLGWVGALPWRSKGDIAVLSGFLAGFLERHDLRFRHAGALAHGWEFALEARIPPWRLDQSPMVPIEEHEGQFAGMDIAVIPMADKPFNHAKCLDATTRVSTPNGLVRIDTVQPGHVVWNGESWSVVEEVEHAPARQGMKVTTEAGHELTMTNEHRMLVDGAWHRADAIQPGATMRLSPWEFGLRKVAVPFGLFQTRQSRENPDYDGTGGASLPQVVIDETWGSLLGFFVGDGSCTRNAVTVSVDGQDPDVIDHVKRLFWNIGLHSGTEHEVVDWAGNVIRRRSVRASSRKLLDFLEALGVADVPAGQSARRRRIPCVPDVIWRSPRGVVAAFIRGYFEADGCLTSAGVEACSKDRVLLEGIQQLLLGFGIPSRLRPSQGRGAYADRTYWKLSLKRAEADVFAKEIGFVSRRKLDKLNTLTARPHSNAYRPISLDVMVAAVEPCEVRPVDLQVSGSVFIAGGLVSHNSNLKGLQAAAAGVPYVASAMPEYQRLWRDRGIGRTVRNPHQWVNHLEALLDPTVRAMDTLINLGGVQGFGLDMLAQRWEIVLDAVTRPAVVRR